MRNWKCKWATLNCIWVFITNITVFLCILSAVHVNITFSWQWSRLLQGRDELLGGNVSHMLARSTQMSSLGHLISHLYSVNELFIVIELKVIVTLRPCLSAAVSQLFLSEVNVLSLWDLEYSWYQKGTVWEERYNPPTHIHAWAHTHANAHTTLPWASVFSSNTTHRITSWAQVFFI